MVLFGCKGVILFSDIFDYYSIIVDKDSEFKGVYKSYEKILITGGIYTTLFQV